MKKILAINGSASKNSSNLRLLSRICELSGEEFEWVIMDTLADLPHFNPELSASDTPDKVVAFRNAVSTANGVVICTPEYVFSIPSGLKNAIEWCVSTTVFSNKPVGLITASASGLKGHEELQLIMKTIETVFTHDTTLLIRGIKSKINNEGKIVDKQTEVEVKNFTEAFKDLVNTTVPVD